MEGQEKFWRKLWFEGLHGERERREKKGLRGKESHEKFKIKIVGEVCSNIPNAF